MWNLRMKDIKCRWKIQNQYDKNLELFYLIILVSYNQLRYFDCDKNGLIYDLCSDAVLKPNY